MIFKYYPSMTTGWAPDGAALQEFMDKHIHDCGEVFSPDLNGRPYFQLRTESKEL